MHLKMFEFPRAKDVVFVDQYTGRVYMNEANTNEDFWATGSVNLSRLAESKYRRNYCRRGQKKSDVCI